MADETTSQSVTTTATNAVLATIGGIGKHEGQSVILRGWLYALRESGKLLFPIFRDGTGTIQGIVPKAAVTPETFETIRQLTQESSVIVTGKVRADKRAPAAMNSMSKRSKWYSACPTTIRFRSRARNMASTS